MSLLRLRPDGLDLSFYLGDFLLVAAPFVVRYLSGELVNLLLFLPVKFREVRKDREVEVNLGIGYQPTAAKRAAKEFSTHAVPPNMIT